MTDCGYTLVDKDGEEYPCSRPAISWRWYQDVAHEDCLERVCDLHENKGGVRMAALQKQINDLLRKVELAQQYGVYFPPNHDDAPEA
jgi:hypothetical protein